MTGQLDLRVETATQARCAHPKERRRLLYGYDVTCDACGRIIGRCVMLGHIELTPQESLAVGRFIPDTATGLLKDARSKLMQAREGAA